MNAHAQPPAGVRTACPYCGVGCGVLATTGSGGGVAIAGDPMHPANFGALCSKGSAPPHTWWARVAVAGVTGYLLASNDGVIAWQTAARRLFAEGVEAGQLAEYIDAKRGLYRIAAFARGRLEGCLFVGPAGAVPHWDAVKAMFASDGVDAAQRRMVLSGKSADGVPDAGPVVCACFGVGLNVIQEALRGGAVANLDEIGKVLRAGTNCGSCLPELKKIVQGTEHERVAV